MRWFIRPDFEAVRLGTYTRYSFWVTAVLFSAEHGPFWDVGLVAGITYNFLPFMALPLYVSLEQVDPRLIEAAEDLYANKIRAFLRVTLPLSLPGVVAGTLLTFIPAAGDFINAQLLGGPNNHMIGNVIQSKFLELSDYPSAAAMSFILMGAILAFVAVYAFVVGTEQLTGTAL